MPWLDALAETPAGATVTDVITRYVLGYGILGIVAVVLAYVLFKGSFVTQKRADEFRERGREDLLRENTRLIAEKTRAEEQRDAALRIAQEQLVPLLGSFVATSQSLIPLLQELVRRRE